MSELTQHLKAIPPAQKQLLSQAIHLAKLVLVMSATNASSERAFSALKRVKTYLRSTMSNNRLNMVNHLMCLHVHSCRFDELDLKEVANDFVNECPDRRLSVFGRF